MTEDDDDDEDNDESVNKCGYGGSYGGRWTKTLSMDI